MPSDMFAISFSRQLGDCRIELTIRTDRQLVALLGPSGIGKTTALHCIAGLLRPDKGQIILGGQCLFDAASGVDMPADQRGCGYLFQDARLFPHLSVARNLRYGQKRDTARRAMPLEEIADQLDIAHLLHRMPRDLSGGETRRVALARTLLSGPEFLLLDEPLASLDAQRSAAVLDTLAHIMDRSRTPIIYVTHDRSEVARFDATIVELGSAHPSGTRDVKN